MHHAHPAVTGRPAVNPADRRLVLRAHVPAFTLLETLVVISIVSVLMAVLIPALGSARGKIKTLECSSNMRSVATEFALFAEDRSDLGRGDSEKLGRNQFWINDFQDSLYSIDEYWDEGPRTHAKVTPHDGLMLCPAGPPELVKRRGFPCSMSALGPAENVSLAVNMRLYRAVIKFKGRKVLAPAAATHVRARILHHPYVPLIMDVDGETAARRGLEPFYIAPPVASRDDPYAKGRYWVPSMRHDGKTNVAFVGGHVLSSADPAAERWDWSYQAGLGQ